MKILEDGLTPICVIGGYEIVKSPANSRFYLYEAGRLLKDGQWVADSDDLVGAIAIAQGLNDGTITAFKELRRAAPEARAASEEMEKNASTRKDTGGNPLRARPRYEEGQG